MSHFPVTSGLEGRRLWLVRHPRPRLPDGLCYGATDVPVDPDHLSAVVPDLTTRLPLNARWRVSGLSRARALADALLAHRPGQRPALVDERLNEMNFGHWEMQTWDAIDPASLQAWTDSFHDYRCGDGESVAMLLSRVKAVWQVAQNQHQGDEVWFTHAGVIRAVQLLQCAHHLGPERPLLAVDWPRQTLPFGGVTACPLQ